jgi:hypothetical protein
LQRAIVLRTGGGPNVNSLGPGRAGIEACRAAGAGVHDAFHVKLSQPGQLFRIASWRRFHVKLPRAPAAMARHRQIKAAIRATKALLTPVD